MHSGCHADRRPSLAVHYLERRGHVKRYEDQALSHLLRRNDRNAGVR